MVVPTIYMVMVRHWCLAMVVGVVAGYWLDGVAMVVNGLTMVVVVAVFSLWLFVVCVALRLGVMIKLIVVVEWRIYLLVQVIDEV